VDLGVNIDLNILYDNFEIGGKSKFIWIYYPKLPEGENKRGEYPKKQRKMKKTACIKKTSFDNQVTFLYKSDNYPNLKLFKNGNIQITGVKDKDDVEIIVKQVIEEIKRIWETNHSISQTEDFMKKIGFYNFRIRMINTDFKTFGDEEMTEKFLIRRRALHMILISENGLCCCRDNCFGKGNGKGNKNCKKITIAIFESGSVLITGGISFIQIDDAYKYITEIFRNHHKEIKKMDLNNLLVEN